MSAETKLELLGLIDGAVGDGWAHARACRVLDLADVRAHCWRQRLRETGSLDDGRPGGGAVHGLLEWEEQAILDLIETWGWVDRSHRKLAHRGSYTGTVFVAPSTVLRVALKNRVELPGEPVRPRPQVPVFPEVPWERNRIWIWDATHFTRCKRVAYAIVDVVTRYWIGYLVSTEQTHTQVQLLFARALEDQGLLGADGLRSIATGQFGDSGASVTATAETANLNVLNGLITAKAVVALATSYATGATAASEANGSTLLGLVVNGVAYDDGAPTPNTRINLPGVGYVVLNEQMAQGDGIHTSALTVNMIHVYLTDALTGSATGEIIVGSAQSSANL